MSPDTVIDHYRIASKLGEGGMGEVWLATDTKLSRPVAVKLLSGHVADPAARRRFQREAQMASSLNHPHIVTVYDAGDFEDRQYLVTEYVDGGTLQDWAKHKRSWRQIVELLAGVADGLATAHAAGILHRDVKPGNILLTKSGYAKLGDFGLAKLVDAPHPPTDQTVTSGHSGTRPGFIVGTPAYMSPEQALGANLDARSDIFSFGVMLYELLHGARPFQGKTDRELLHAIVHVDPPPLDADIPEPLRTLVEKALEKDPAERYQTMRDLVVDLRRVLRKPAEKSATHELVVMPGARRPWLALAVCALIAAALVAGAARYFWSTPAPPAWTGGLLGGPEVALHPRLSPDGQLLAFIDRQEQVGVMKPASGNWTILTHDTGKGWIMSLSWSPDSAKIYYDRSSDVPQGIYSVPVLGGPEQLVLENAEVPEALPDGSLLLVRLNAERQSQLFRFWPETGKLQGFPIEAPSTSYRSFPDGREAVVFGTLIGPGREAGQHIYVVDLQSGKARRFLSASQVDPKLAQLAVTRDGQSVLVAGSAGNLIRVSAFSRSGRPAVPVLFSVPGQISSFDMGLDGSIYLDQVERPKDLVRFAPEGGRAAKIATLPAATEAGCSCLVSEIIAILPDGRTVIPGIVNGRLSLMVVEAGKEPAPFLNTAEETASPVTAAGPDQVAFLIGPEPRRTIALASTSNGRIVRRIPFDKGPIVSLASSPDGKVIYCGADGAIWSIPASGGEPKKIRDGDFVAADPDGKYLVIPLTETAAARLIRIPVDGGAEQEIRFSGTLRPDLTGAVSFGPNAIGKDGRIVMPLSSTTWHDSAGVFDPKTNRFTRIPEDQLLDYHVLGWTPDGKVIGLGLGLRGKLWKFTPEKR